MCLKHGLESGETGGLSVLLDGANIDGVHHRLWGSSVAGAMRFPVCHCGVPVGQSLGLRVDLLKPQGWETSQEQTIQHLGVHMAEES